MTGSNQSYVTKFEIVFFTLDKSRDSELQNGMFWYYYWRALFVYTHSALFTPS